jgi:hypothetical protein
VLIVRATVDSKAELCGVRDSASRRTRSRLKPTAGGLLAGGLPQQFVEALSDTFVVGFYDREMCVQRHGEGTRVLLVEECQWSARASRPESLGVTRLLHSGASDADQVEYNDALDSHPQQVARNCPPNDLAFCSQVIPKRGLTRKGGTECRGSRCGSDAVLEGAARTVRLVSVEFHGARSPLAASGRTIPA